MTGITINDEKRAKISDVLAHGVASSTAAAYAADVELWKEFHREENSDDLLLAQCSGDHTTRTDIWILFIAFLLHKGKREEQVHSVLTGVRDFLLTSHVDISFLCNPLVGRARKGAKRTHDEHRVYLSEKVRRAKLPAFTEMLEDMRAHLWTGSWEDKPARLARAVYLAFMITCNEGPRVSNLTPPDGTKKEDHGCKAKDLVFTLASEEQMAAGAEGTVARLAVSSNVTSACLSYVTSKPGQSKGKGTEKKVIMRRSPEESQLLDDLVEWVTHANLSGDDRLFVVKIGAKPLHLRAKDIRGGVKNSADRCGVPRRHFSTSSGRKFFATQMSLAGAPREEIRAVGGWSENSTVPDTHYNRASSLRGSLAMLADPTVPRLRKADIVQLLPFVQDSVE